MRASLHPLRRAATALLIAALLALVSVAGAGIASAAEPNPPWQARCPQRVVLVLDLSSSTEPYLDDIKQSASDLVDALRGSPNQVAVVGFGSSARVDVPALDVGDDGQRTRLKDMVDDIALSPGDGGGTNWEEALTTAASLRPDVVLFLTDGEPTVHGTASTGYEGGTDDLTPAVRAADRMRASGTRIVGVGMGLQSSSVTNLQQVTGPAAGDDYYETSSDASGLLGRLYDVAGKTCGIPVAALPQPEGGGLPTLPIVGGVVAAALLAALVGFLLNRRSSSAPPAARPAPRRLQDETIRSVGDPPGADVEARRSSGPPAAAPETAPAPEPEPSPPTPSPPARSGRISSSRVARILADSPDPRSGSGD